MRLSEVSSHGRDMQLRRLVIDVLVPHEPDILVYSEKISEIEDTDGLTIRVVEMDDQTKTLEMTIEGQALSLEAIKETIDELGGSIPLDRRGVRGRNDSSVSGKRRDR